MRSLCIVSLALIVASCVPSRPGRLVEADFVGLVISVGVSKTGEPTLEFEDGLVITVPQSSVALYGSGYNAGHLFLYGEEFGRSWYVALRLHENSPINGCYRIAGVAYDEPDSVIIVAGDEWPGVGLRLPKRGDFEVPDGAVGSDGLYQMGDEYPVGRFCIDTTGSVFSLPFP